MPSDRSLLERHMAGVEIRPFTIDEFHRRRHRQQRNRRITTAVSGVALVAVAVAGVLGATGLVSEDKTITTDDVAGPGLTPPSPYVGTWESTDTDGSQQTLEIQPVGAAGEYRIELHDDMASAACANAPATLTGTGRIQSDGSLGTAMEVTCDDGSTPAGLVGDEASVQAYLDELANMSVRYDRQNDELLYAEVAWRRVGVRATVEGSSPFEGSWVSTDGDTSSGSLEIRHLLSVDTYLTEVHQSGGATRCPEASSMTTGTGRRQTDDSGLEQLVTSAVLTCDDGTAPLAQSTDEGRLVHLEITYVYDPATDELVDSEGTRWSRG